jgi:hypothetical protein
MEWISVDDKLPKGICEVVMVKQKDGRECKVYYHKDKMAWAHQYRKFPWSNFQDFKTLEWLTDVTHWKLLPNANKD